MQSDDGDGAASADDDTVDLATRPPRSARRGSPVQHEAAHLHRVRAGAEVVALDRPLVVGRRPSLPRIVVIPEPRLLTVSSPRGEVSASHLEIRQQGSAVVVTDLRSTNGTRVIIPGRQPVALRQGESIVVLAGTIVDIGDGNHLEILPIKRFTPQEEPHP